MHEVTKAICRRREWMAYQLLAGPVKNEGLVNRIIRFVKSLY